jgi:hypothetical protein
MYRSNQCFLFQRRCCGVTYLHKMKLCFVSDLPNKPQYCCTQFMTEFPMILFRFKVAFLEYCHNVWGEGGLYVGPHVSICIRDQTFITANERSSALRVCTYHNVLICSRPRFASITCTVLTRVWAFRCF